MNSKTLKLLLYISVILVISLTTILIFTFIQNGDTDLTTTDHKQVIIDAINTRNRSVYQKAIDEGADLRFAIDRGPNQGRTPLEVLIEDFDLSYAQKLIQNGFDLKKVNNNHIDTITDILGTNKITELEVINEIIKTLINQVKDELENPDSYGFSLLMNATYVNNNEISLLIIENIQNVDRVYLDETALTFSCQLGYVDISVIKALIEQGANVNFQGENGNTCLMYALMNDDEELVKYLLTKTNVNINLKNNDGQTALHIASEYLSNKTIGYLLNHKDIDLNVTDNNGDTPYT
ncbi:MAG: ankyrin repeat domain-containing protein, partial [Bacilli bacterium]|nr:ankyrin repeat domain-containing protein [Bacilli bacterium]